MDTKSLIEETDNWLLYETPIGKLYVFKLDTRGDVSGKKGTTKMIYHDCPPRPIELRKKHRGG